MKHLALAVIAAVLLLPVVKCGAADTTPAATVVERPGITGGGWAVVAGDAASQRVTKVSGGNTSMTAIDADTLLVFTPSSKRISCWKVALPKSDAKKP